MKLSVSKRIISAVLILCILFSLVPVFHAVEAKALSGIDSLTCADFISNSTACNYIDVMMRYYLNNNSKLRNTLDDGLSVIFMFEGGSDNYQEYGSTYANSAYDIRNQSVVIVVQKDASSKPYVVDRQLGLTNPSGTEYGSGSLIELYNETALDQLAPGKYTYVIEAKYKNYFAKENTLWYYHPSTTLLSQYFVVVPNDVSQSSCTHSYVTSTLVAPTCTDKGSAVKYCSNCGKLTTETLPALGHSYGSQTCKHIEPIDLTPYQSQWLETIPEGFDEGLFAIRNQYRPRAIGDHTWSEWEDGVALSSPDQEVQTRTLYRMKAMPFGDHSWSDGTCIHCSTGCDHQYENKYCTACGYREPDEDLYLFGWINGANYACEEDAENTGDYKFVDGKLVVTFTQRSYVAVKTGDNQDWYMTDRWLGMEATEGILYNTDSGAYEKLFVPAGKVVTFFLTDNGDDTLTLSYIAEDCLDLRRSGLFHRRLLRKPSLQKHGLLRPCHGNRRLRLPCKAIFRLK